MFGKKKNNVKTFVDGESKEKVDDVIVPLPPIEEKVEPSQVVSQTEPEQQFECQVCRDYGWYADAVGVCHNCPRCNSKSLKKPNISKKGD